MSYRRGTFYLVTAWSIFIGSTSLLYIGMARLLGPQQFGVFGLVFSILYWIEIILMYGVPHTVQKYVASHEAQGSRIFRISFRVQAGISVFLFILAFLLAPWIASLFHLPERISTLRIAFGELLFLGLYYLIMAYENGRRHFFNQALLFGAWSVLRTGFMFGGYLLFRSLEAVFAANALATLICLCAAIWIRPEPGAFLSDLKGMIRFTILSACYFLLMNLLFFIDLWGVQFYLGEEASGYYVAASMIAKTPFFLFFGFSMTMLPVLSAVLGRNRRDAAAVIREGVHSLLLLAFPLTALLSGFSGGLVRLVFSEAFIPSAGILAILVWGMAGLALLALLTTVLNADDRIHRSVQIMAVVVVLSFFLNRAWIPRFGVSGGAAATSLSILSGVIVSAVMTARRFGVFWRGGALVRIIPAAAAAYGFSRICPQSHRAVIPFFLFGMLLYGVILYGFGEKEPFLRVLSRLKTGTIGNKP